MLKDYFKIQAKPQRGLLALEWVMLAYLALTMIMVFFTYEPHLNSNSSFLYHS